MESHSSPGHGGSDCEEPLDAQDNCRELQRLQGACSTQNCIQSGPGEGARIGTAVPSGLEDQGLEAESVQL
jgi:hypothetical protein